MRCIFNMRWNKDLANTKCEIIGRMCAVIWQQVVVTKSLEKRTRTYDKVSLVRFGEPSLPVYRVSFPAITGEASGE